MQEIPTNPFDFIWDTNNLMPKLENDENGLGTINEEFSDLKLNRNKTNLGGRVSKSSEEHRIANLNDSNHANMIPSFDNSIDENKKASKKKKKNSEIKR